MLPYLELLQRPLMLAMLQFPLSITIGFASQVDDVQFFAEVFDASYKKPLRVHPRPEETRAT